MGQSHIRSFPDGESYIQIDTDVRDRDIIIVDSLDYPNPKILPLIFLAATAKDLGAKRVGLVAPYLAYMRQDKRFNAGEGITSAYFANLLSHTVDWLITVDPHLHRYQSLSEIYTIPTQVVRAGPSIAEWISHHIPNPLLIGPDAESEQWVASIAKHAQAPYVISQKERHGDQAVSIVFPSIEKFQNFTPVLVDDIISTAQTMIENIKHLQSLKMLLPICIGIHGIFANNAYQDLLKTGISRVVTCNTVSHPTNAIDIIPSLVEAVRYFKES